MKKCYIAGKIGDLPEAEYKANFEQAKEEVRALGYEPVSPVDLPHNHGKSWKEYMIEDLKALLDCDAVYAQRNVRFSPGGMIEITTANSIGITVIHQAEKFCWLKKEEYEFLEKFRQDQGDKIFNKGLGTP